MCVVHGLLWVMGGADDSGNVLASVEVYNPGSWLLRYY